MMTNSSTTTLRSDTIASSELRIGVASLLDEDTLVANRLPVLTLQPDAVDSVSSS
jgi:hypothetical protein